MSRERKYHKPLEASLDEVLGAIADEKKPKKQKKKETVDKKKKE